MTGLPAGTDSPSADASSPVSQAVSAPAPGLWRRMACFTYEGVLLFAVWMIAGYLYSSLTQQRHALAGRSGLMAFLYTVTAIYFVWFWHNGGQTVAMKAWHIRLVDHSGNAVSQPRALVRFALSWLWFLPALMFAWFSGLTASVAVTFSIVFAGVLAYALLARLHPQRQFFHDVVCGTRLVTYHPPPRTRR